MLSNEVPMKRAILPALFLGLLLSVPAVPQDGGDGELKLEIQGLQEQLDKQGKALKELQTYVSNQKGQAAALVKALKKAEKKGFTYPAPHNDARKALLSGLQKFAAVAAGGNPQSEKE